MTKNEITFLQVELKPWKHSDDIAPGDYKLDVRVIVDGTPHFAERFIPRDHLESFFDQIMDQVKKEMKHYLQHRGGDRG